MMEMPIDPQALRKFIRMGGNELALELVDRFLREGPERLGRAQQGVAAGDCQPAEEHCHRLASDAGWLGAREFQKLASAAEILAVDRKADELAQALTRLQALCGPLLEHLPALRQALLEGRDPCDCM